MNFQCYQCPLCGTVLSMNESGYYNCDECSFREETMSLEEEAYMQTQ